MSEITPSLVEFYQKHGISPVRQDISNLERHFTRRAALYRHLGLLPGYFRGRSVIEIGPGSGFNSVFTATLSPSRYVLLEGNPRGVADIERLFGEHGLRDRIEIVTALVQDFNQEGQFDIVICEGMLALAGVPDPTDLLRAVARLVAPGGVLIITTIDAMSDFAETLRRLFAQLLLNPSDSLHDQAAKLTPIFSPHLSTLAGMSRPHDDWVIDNLLNPASIGPYLSIPDAVAGLGDDFAVFGTSPQFITDWRWYKTIVPGETRYNEIGLDQYWRNAHNLLDHRWLFASREPADNRRFYALCESTRDEIRRFESTRDVAVVTGIRERLRTLASEAAVFSPAIATAIGEVETLLASQPIDGGRVAASPDFGRWFGRGQQYLSFSRTAPGGTWSSQAL